MSPAERFVRHNKREADCAISQAYSRLTPKSLARATFGELLHCVRERSALILGAPVVNGHHPERTCGSRSDLYFDVLR